MSYSTTRIIGTCNQMCPLEEIKFREKNNLLSKFETSNNYKGRLPKADPAKCVKEFRRSAAGEKIDSPKVLRTADVLLMTTKYLMIDILQSNCRFVQKYDFIFDRLRCVRQDLSIQEINKHDSLVYAKALCNCIKFYAYSEYIISQDQIKGIDLHINRTHLKETLGLITMHLCENPHLFEHSFTLDIFSVYLFNDLDALDSLYFILSNIPRHIRNKKPLKNAIQIKLHLSTNNLVAVTRTLHALLPNASILFSLFSAKVISYVRQLIMKMYNTSHSSKACKYPLEKMCALGLWSKEIEILHFCEKCEIKLVNHQYIVFSKLNDENIKIELNGFASIDHLFPNGIMKAISTV